MTICWISCFRQSWLSHFGGSRPTDVVFSSTHFYTTRFFNVGLANAVGLVVEIMHTFCYLLFSQNWRQIGWWNFGLENNQKYRWLEKLQCLPFVMFIHYQSLLYRETSILGGWFVKPGTRGRPAIFRLPEWSSCWAPAVGPVHSIWKACASGLNLILFLVQSKVYL